LLGRDDARRMELLPEAASAGAGMIDVVGDLFCPSPDERAVDDRAITRQMEVVAAIHRMGSQAILSSHPQRRMRYDEVFAQLTDFAARGADVVKIVASADDEEAYVESLETTVKLARNLATPFVHLCAGKYSRRQRLAALPLGGAITFAVWRYHDFAPYTQPTIEEFCRERDASGGKPIRKG
ncbi:MAG: type I 3-dehydroquinate dehydratase, partial [Victivallaceae bacterium]|nr:type I 3-dehydroquinate dehydratase [Victivallaceae bacterium]